MSRRKPTKVQQWFSEPIKEAVRMQQATERAIKADALYYGRKMIEADEEKINECCKFADTWERNRPIPEER